jgi:hypothetical protein
VGIILICGACGDQHTWQREGGNHQTNRRGRAARVVRDRSESTNSDSGSYSSSSSKRNRSEDEEAKPIFKADMEMFKKLVKRPSMRQMV